MFRKFALTGLCVATFAGCRADETQTPVDLSRPLQLGDLAGLDFSGNPTGGDMALPPGTDLAGMMPSGCMNSYMQATISAMRQGKSGCYELDNVISIGVTPSKTSPALFVQDALGGDYSGMMTKCESKSTSHPCASLGNVMGAVAGHSVTVLGTYIKSKTSGFEEFYVDSATDNGVADGGATPAPVTTLTEAQIAHAASPQQTAKWFQRVVVTITDPLKVYDYSPTDLHYTGSLTPCTQVPNYFGFSMIPSSLLTGGVTQGGVCSGTGNLTPPTAQANTPAQVVYIGTNFYKTFTETTDCACNSHANPTPSVGASISTTLSGILIGDSVYGSSTTFQDIAPQSGPGAGTDFPLQ
jgi:hypothetical protein